MLEPRKSIFSLKTDWYEQVTRFRVLTTIIDRNKKTKEIEGFDFKDIERHAEQQGKVYRDIIQKLFHEIKIPEAIFYDEESEINSWKEWDEILFMVEGESPVQMTKRMRAELKDLRARSYASGVKGNANFWKEVPVEWPFVIKGELRMDKDALRIRNEKNKRLLIAIAPKRGDGKVGVWNTKDPAWVKRWVRLYNLCCN